MVLKRSSGYTPNSKKWCMLNSPTWEKEEGDESYAYQRSCMWILASCPTGREGRCFTKLIFGSLLFVFSKAIFLKLCWRGMEPSIRNVSDVADGYIDGFLLMMTGNIRRGDDYMLAHRR